MGLGIKRTALFFSFFHVLNLVSAQNRGSPETRPSILWGDEGEAIQNIIGEWNEKNKDMEAILPGWVRGSKSINPCLYGDAHATWKGLGCFGPTVSYLNGSYIDYYYIIALQISGTQVQGILPSSIVHLSYLVFLTITDNPKLTGPISLSLTFLTRLKMIDLHANNLTGTIPEWNTSMESLVEIDFHRNRLEGSIPSLHNCHLLGFLDLSENLLSGPIPKVFPPQLKTLQLAHNRFSWNYACLEGHSILRFWLHELAYLTTLNLSYNQLSGQLPHCWGNLTSLVTLDVSNNTFSGSIGRSLFRNWTKLQYLYGDNNNFSGVLDLSEVNYTSMRQISLVNNSISRVILPDLLYQNTFSLLLGGNPVCNNNNQIPVEYCRSDGNTIIVVKKGMILNP